MIVMASDKRIRIDKNQFAWLISEVEGLCPLCQESLIISKQGTMGNISQAAHIYPHSPSEEEKRILAEVPRLSDSPESIENLIMLCPSCHSKFDHPRTRDEYMQLYQIKKAILRRNAAKEYYKAHNLEEDFIVLLNSIEPIDAEADTRQLSYNAMTVRAKMNRGASNSVIQTVIRNVRDYYVPIQEALIQIEQDAPGKSDLLAKRVSLFYSTLLSERFTQDEIYWAIVDWFNQNTNHRYEALTPLITAFYIQNCEVYSL